METILSKIAFLRAEIGRLQQEVANLEREHEKEILAAALRDRQEAGIGASGFETVAAGSNSENDLPKVVDPNEMLRKFIDR